MVDDEKKYYEVVAKCGHVGRRNCIMIHFAVMAHDGKQAAARVKKYKRVKRDHKDCIQSVTEISFEQFMTLRAKTDADPYLHSKSKWQQKQIEDFEWRLEPDRYNLRRAIKRTDRKESRKYRLKKLIYAEKADFEEIVAYSYGR
jgi:hypothetical protein